MFCHSQLLSNNWTPDDAKTVSMTQIKHVLSVFNYLWEFYVTAIKDFSNIFTLNKVEIKYEMVTLQLKVT